MSAIFKKLQLKTANPILIQNAPDEFQPHVAEFDDMVEIHTGQGHTEKTGGEPYEFALVFVKSAADIDAAAGPATKCISDDGLLWFAYPKKSSKNYKTDISRDSGWQPLGDLGFEPVRQIAIDADWSALRFRRVGNIKTMTRSFAMSEEGKKRTGKK